MKKKIECKCVNNKPKAEEQKWHQNCCCEYDAAHKLVDNTLNDEQQTHASLTLVSARMCVCFVSCGKKKLKFSMIQR